MSFQGGDSRVDGLLARYARAESMVRQLQGGPWHEVGATGEPAFAGTWANSGGAYETAAFRLLGPATLALKGTVRGSAVNALATIFTLPVGYRPLKERRMSAWIADGGGNIAAAMLLVRPSGTVGLYSLAIGAVAISDGGIETVIPLTA